MNPRQQDIVRRLKEFADWMVSAACGNVPDEATLADEAAREIEELVREVSIWRRGGTNAVIRPREDIIEDSLRLWFTIKDTTNVDPAYRIVMAAVVDFVTAVEHERCKLSSKALRDVAEERARQIVVEGWTQEHDDEHVSGEMARAAASYAYEAGRTDAQRAVDHGDPPLSWPWDSTWWKPTDRRRDLIKAAALIIAEIERLDRREEAA